MSNTIEIQVGDRTLTATKAHLKLWLQLSDTYEKFLQASKESNYTLLGLSIYEYLDLYFAGVFNWHEATWYDTVLAFSELVKLNVLDLDLPISHAGKKEIEKSPWDYPQRSWYAWAHILAKNYGWSLEYIAELEIEDALALLEEVDVNEQFEKEFMWMLSEIAYPYNVSTKKSEFKPLPRPDWMLPNAEVKKVTMLKSMLPMGVVENLSGMFSESVVKNDA